MMYLSRLRLPCFLAWLLVTMAVPPVVAQNDPGYSLEHYPDADEALENLLSGGDKEKQPYYIWRDAQGHMHTTPYDPEKHNPPGSPAEQAEKAKEAKAYRWSQALDLFRDADAAESPVMEGDPKAQSLLGLSTSGNAVQHFASNCCQDLLPSNRRPLPMDRGQGINIDRESEHYPFVTGTSHYSLWKLPAASDPWALRLRSFSREGVLLPTLVFLNKDRQPLRMVTEIQFNYEPARWHRLGYIEAVLPMAQQQSEESAYVLVLTRQQDLKSQTAVTLDKQGQAGVLRHRRYGELELKLFSR